MWWKISQPSLRLRNRKRIGDLARRAPAGELPFPEGVPYALRFSRDGALLLAAGGRGAQSGKVVLFDVRTREQRGEIGQEMDIVLTADISADGKLVALGGPSKIVYSVADNKLIYQLTKTYRLGNCSRIQS